MKQILAIVFHSILISGALISGSWAYPHGHNVQQVHRDAEVSHQKDGHRNLPCWENDVWEGQVWGDFS